MDEKDFEMLADLAKTCNITKSAQRLYTTQSALTKRVQKLEQELGTELFLRTKKGLLTPLELPCYEKWQFARNMPSG